MAPARPFLTTHEVHVWCASLDDPTDVRFYEAQLSPEERSRALRFKFPKDHDRFVVSHGILRQILSRYLQLTSRELELTATANGKPELAPMPQKRAVQFNMSHSRDLALFAVTRGREVGIDVEYNDETFAFDEIAQRFFLATDTRRFIHFLFIGSARHFSAAGLAKRPWSKPKAQGWVPRSMKSLSRKLATTR